MTTKSACARVWKTTVLVAAVALLVGAAPDSAASGLTWDDLRDTVLEVMPPGEAQVALVAAVDAIEYQELHGTHLDILAAYDSFLMEVIQHYALNHLSEATGNELLGSFQAVSQDNQVKLDIGGMLLLVPFRSCQFLSCIQDGIVCVSYGWSFDNGTWSGSGRNCLSI